MAGNEWIIYPTIILVIAILAFHIFRFFWLWYWRINEHIANQRQIIQLLTQIESNTRSEGMLSPDIPVRPPAHTTPLIRQH